MLKKENVISIFSKVAVLKFLFSIIVFCSILFLGWNKEASAVYSTCEVYQDRDIIYYDLYASVPVGTNSGSYEFDSVCNLISHTYIGVVTPLFISPGSSGSIVDWDGNVGATFNFNNISVDGAYLDAIQGSVIGQCSYIVLTEIGYQTFTAPPGGSDQQCLGSKRYGVSFNANCDVVATCSYTDCTGACNPGSFPWIPVYPLLKGTYYEFLSMSWTYHENNSLPNWICSSGTLYRKAGVLPIPDSRRQLEPAPYACILSSDTEDPNISITTPNTNPFNTVINTISIIAQASDNIGVDSVTWSNDRGGNGNANETTDWSVPSIVLQTGANIITLTAYDAAGNSTSDTITINYNPDSTTPIVNIQYPSNTGFYATTSASVIVTGTSSDATGNITGTRWSDDNWLSTSNAPGQDDWTASNVPLYYGMNEIIIGSRDNSSNLGTSSIIITRLPPNGELIGYAWTDTIGWISMSSKNCDPDEDWLSNSDIVGCPRFVDGDDITVAQYNVEIDQTNGQLSGYAWSENVGWISFQQASTTPDNQAFSSACLSSATCTDQSGCTACYQPNHPTKPLGIGAVYGWANILSLGDDGWINLGSNTNSLYGVEFNILSKEFSAYAWSGAGSASNVDAGLGWVSFSCIDDGDCNISNYRVLASLNLPPTVTYLFDTPETELPCGPGDGTQGACDPSINCEVEPVVDWLYNDPEGYTQASYRFIIDEVSGSGYYNSGIQDSSITQIKLDTEISIKYDTVYDISIEVWDNFGLSSGVVTHTFRTDQHQYPNPYFDWFVEEGSAEEEILFWDQSIYYDDNNTANSPGFCDGLFGYSSACQYDWNSLDAIIPVITQATATTTANYPNEGTNQRMNLTVTDGDGYSCATSSTMEINKKLPSWIEVR